ncbi:hypothetical protein VTJ83DRAFT_7165 [Remersonia thermophila]|uniref:Nitrogen regulatory protein areA GATA-like domain-containing protein n=1 Tax=Remersonia thermophila TaxID=72144 RepID=A0ABR4D2Q2_9PEZI
MPMSLEAPVLQVDANVIHKVDTTNPSNLFSMWTVFARCRDSVAQGRRLENLTWRLLSSSATSQPWDIEYPRTPSNEDAPPQLSGSVDSVADEEAVDLTTSSSPVYMVRPRIQRQDSCASSRSRGRDRLITSDELEKMVLSIMEAKEPLNAPLPSIPRSPSVEETTTNPQTAEQPAATPCEPRCEPRQPAQPQEIPQLAKSQTIITRGFSPAQPSQVYLRPSSLVNKAPSPSTIPQPADAPAPKIVLPKKEQAKFTLGVSSGSDEESYKSRDLETRKMVAQPPRKRFQLGASPSDDSPQTNGQPQRLAPSADGQKKTTSFNHQVVTQTYTSSAISDTEDDYLDESAIDDDDDEWEEESAEESGSSVGESKIQFKRVDSTANLPSRRSLITLMLSRNDRSQRLGGVASQSTSALPRARTNLNGPQPIASPNDSDDGPLMMKRSNLRAPPMRPINEIPRSSAQPINVTAATGIHAGALSPRTTRRHMLATELTDSLRRNLLLERSHKSSTANAVLKRRHTSQDIANLKQYPERPYMKKETDKEIDNDPSNWNQYFQNPFSSNYAQAW